MAMLPIIESRSFDVTTLTANYQDVGATMGSPVYSFICYNTGNVACQLSLDDGATDGPIIPAGETFGLSRFEQISNIEEGVYMLPQGAQIQVKQVTAAASSGSLIINVARR